MTSSENRPLKTHTCPNHVLEDTSCITALKNTQVRKTPTSLKGTHSPCRLGVQVADGVTENVSISQQTYLSFWMEVRVMFQKITLLTTIFGC